MSRLLIAAPFIILCALIIAVPSVWAYWVQDGMTICTATGTQQYPTITSDGAGGAIVTWIDYRSGYADIYAQRVNVSGTVQWTTNGVALCTATGYQENPTITSDGAGGAIVTWQDFRSGNLDIYAQRVNASGTVQWTTNGVALCTATEYQHNPTITSDGAGGAIVTWYDVRSGDWDIYAQRVNASGAVQWTTNGVALCTATGHQINPTITSDGAGGAIVTWSDYRSGYGDIYAQRVNALGAAQWTTNGVALCTATDDQYAPQITSDGAGGAIVTWTDYRSGNLDICAQRVNASGTVQWTRDGIALCTATGTQQYPTITSDGEGGAIVTWNDYRSGTSDIYAQRVNALGAVHWTKYGVALCTATGSQAHPTITSDGAGGAIVTWYDSRSGANDIYAQRVNASGTVRWTTNGVALCTATGYQENPTITSDGAGGAIVTWWDTRSGDWDIYAQSIDAKGRAGFLGPNIYSIRDVPGDQGGLVRITIERSKLDDALENAFPVSTYNIWQRIDDAALLALVAQGSADAAPGAWMDKASLEPSVDASSVSGWPLTELGDRYFVPSTEMLEAVAFPPGIWELLGSFAACQQDQYIYRASTLADSTASGIPYSVYMVSAHTTTPSLWFMSDPDSGYSVDNIPPEPPEGLVAEQSYMPTGLELSWNVNAANDLSHYVIYRDLSEGFVPTPENRVATPIEPEWFDESWSWSGGYYYKVSALDVHGNESGFALLAPDAITGIDTPNSPAASYLAQNYPNPFNPTTRIAFGLSEPAHVSLRIYDAAGRLVRALVESDRPAGNFTELWNGRDSNGRSVASGNYFCRLETAGGRLTRQLSLVK